ncbi:MAG: helix-turn-helix domain-containing protein [Gammaproteobacteria bacterium]|nr:helix-turn-helix domain-containing protein [Gammaproteobacteria bacterium]MYE31038.1 helix-turn-helix domain-containing protein [Gammaproteobacteria bacterium]
MSLEIFAERLHKLRIGKKLSQMQLADRTDISQVQLSSYENSRQMPRVTTLLSLCDVLETTPNYLLGYDDNAKTDAQRVAKQPFCEPKCRKMSGAKMYEFLLVQQGQRCQGCDREFDDSRYLELHHNTPRSDGGINHVANRILLCGPCNRLKSNIYTLSGLRRENKKRGYMSHAQTTDTD